MEEVILIKKSVFKPSGFPERESWSQGTSTRAQRTVHKLSTRLLKSEPQGKVQSFRKTLKDHTMPARSHITAKSSRLFVTFVGKKHPSSDSEH